MADIVSSLVQNKLSDAQRDPERFERDASAVLVPLQEVLVRLIGLVPGRIRKSMDLQKALDLAPKPAWQVYKFAFASSALQASVLLPGPAAIRRFLETAEQRGVPNSAVTAVSLAFDAFEAFVADRVGDRTSYNSMVGGGDESDAASIAHKRAAFRTASHFLGVQTDVNFVSFLLRPRNEIEGPWDFGIVSYKVGVRRLRRDARVMLAHYVTGATITPSETAPYLLPVDGRIGDDGELASMIPSFCSFPQADATTTHRKDRYIELELAASGLGSVATSDWAFGLFEKNTSHRIMRGVAPLSFDADIVSSVQTLVIDVLLDERIDIDPVTTVQTYVGTFEGTSVPDVIRHPCARLHVNESIVNMGRANVGLKLDEAPRYPELMEHVTQRQGWRLDQFKLYRCLVKYPMMGTNLKLTFDPTRSEAK